MKTSGRLASAAFSLSLLLMGCTEDHHLPYIYWPTLPPTANHIVMRESTLYGPPQLSAWGVQVIIVGQYVRIVIPSDQILDLNSDRLNPCGETVMLIVTNYILRCHGLHVVVAGYADNVQPQERSLVITRRQAQSVMAFLYSHGIPIEGLDAMGFGRESNIAANDRALGSYYNRRIEITFSLY